jgi:hypothetical protein
VYQVDEDRDGTVDYNFDRPDFDVRDLSSPWWCAGSTGRLAALPGLVPGPRGRASPGGLRLGPGMREAFGGKSTTCFLIKFSKWFSL